MATILVVDDDRQVRAMVSRAVKQAGHEPIEAETGHEAIRQALELRPAMLLMDLRLGEKQPDGLTVFKTIRREHPHAIGVMMTAYGTEELALECWRAGMAGYLKKPFPPRDVVQAIRTALEKRVPHGSVAPPVEHRRPEQSRNAVVALIEQLRAPESGNLDGTEVIRKLKASLVDILLDPTGAVPLILTCGPVLGALAQRGGVDDAICSICELAANLRQNLDRVMSLAMMPRTSEVAEALALIEAGALDGGFPSEGELARQVGRSQSQLSRGIVDATGFTFLMLAQGYRLRPALPRILSSREHIDQIAYDAGYSDVRQFRRDFHVVFGVSARSLRRYL